MNALARGSAFNRRLLTLYPNSVPSKKKRNGKEENAFECGRIAT